jgi:hypothetical protein
MELGAANAGPIGGFHHAGHSDMASHGGTRDVIKIMQLSRRMHYGFPQWFSLLAWVSVLAAVGFFGSQPHGSPFFQPHMPYPPFSTGVSKVSICAGVVWTWGREVYSSV